jgi:hypothetical protein
MDAFEFEVDLVLTAQRRVLLEKNKKYGDAALSDMGVFSFGKSPLDRLRVRIDDKLARVRAAVINGTQDDEDTLLDLMNYLVLYRIALRLEKKKEDNINPLLNLK